MDFAEVRGAMSQFLPFGLEFPAWLWVLCSVLDGNYKYYSSYKAGRDMELLLWQLAKKRTKNNAKEKQNVGKQGGDA